MNPRILTTAPAMGALLAALALAGCSKQPQDDPQATGRDSTATVVARNDAPSDSSNRTLDDAKQTARDLGQDAKQAGEKASQDLKQAGNAVNDKVTDAVITTSVNAELAKDQSLRATKIDVDTSAGHVALHGTAPSAVARDRATQLALAVKGVVSVDNQLVVQM